jgi:hypothetical protein
MLSPLTCAASSMTTASYRGAEPAGQPPATRSPPAADSVQTFRGQGGAAMKVLVPRSPDTFY